MPDKLPTILPQTPKAPTDIPLASSPIPRLPRPIYNRLQQSKAAGRKSFAVLLDPDNLNAEACLHVLQLAQKHPVDYFFMGGSLVVHQHQAQLIALIKQHSQVPVVLFPSSHLHIDPQADAILFLSLISGRNPDLLIGQQVLAAPLLKASRLEVMSTGYMLIDSGQPTTASYMSGTLPIPNNKPGIAACTALAGEMLGLSLVYLDGGSGAQQPVSQQLISAVADAVAVPIIVGGGITTATKAEQALQAGADVIVIGNEIERNPAFLGEVAQVVRQLNDE